ncbi:hypothetical protein Pure05_23790 [Paenarthrobacter ureafaciens]|nr:hypothetical protein Pure01_23810 [Paenarthrobacter ureafaciens]GLU64335.1 hypothetical protein Pure02_25850 [Paenarthrobacter ureafaciens]GLU68612.1 hypothetical protein Pure03_25880 [Paenarthrobacter ureafaciens]GLU72870.1 hypothetical protein Pure04_25850 [Paenarthrobacter ureafaciens]GLU76939.1 hypothetical protein Pure05_23790 [Paenarthrobacter ureafaciens]
MFAGKLPCGAKFPWVPAEFPRTRRGWAAQQKAPTPGGRFSPGVGAFVGGAGLVEVHRIHEVREIFPVDELAEVAAEAFCNEAVLGSAEC